MDPTTSFYFYFAEEATARRAATSLREKGFEVEVGLGADDENWLALARKVVRADDLEDLEEEFEEQARVQHLIRRTVDEFGELNVVFNNAGISRPEAFLDITEDSFRRIMEVNGLGVLIGMQEAVRQFTAQGSGGKIVNTASIAARQRFPDFAHYCASKAAVHPGRRALIRGPGRDRQRVRARCRQHAAVGRPRSRPGRTRQQARGPADG